MTRWGFSAADMEGDRPVVMFLLEECRMFSTVKAPSRAETPVEGQLETAPQAFSNSPGLDRMVDWRWWKGGCHLESGEGKKRWGGGKEVRTSLFLQAVIVWMLVLTSHMQPPLYDAAKV